MPCRYCHYAMLYYAPCHAVAAYYYCYGAAMPCHVFADYFRYFRYAAATFRHCFFRVA